MADQSSIEDDYFSELPVVLSASRLSQPLSEAPNAMTVINREMIKASGFRTVADLFRLVPGMYVANASGWRQVVAYHGTTDDYARRMQVLVDGRSVFMPPLGAVAWENLPLQIDDIERIEVIRGPAAASHGGNSTQGVINIFTRDAGDVRGFKVSVSKGNGGIADASVSFGMPGERFDYRISAGYKSDHGYDAVNVLVPGNPTPEIAINNDSYKTRLFNLRASFRPSPADSIDVQAGYTSGSRGSGHLDPDPEPAHDRFTHENFTQLTWSHSMDDGDELKLQYYHIYQDVLNEIPPPVGFPAYSDSFTNTRDDWELQHTLHTSSENRLVWGASTRRDWTRAEHQFREEQNLKQYNLFAHDEWRFSPQWLLNVGAMQEDNGMGEKNVSPRMALIHKLTEKQSLRIGISKAYRNPSVYEERGYLHFPETIVPFGQPYIFLEASGGLKSESVLSREVGYLGEFSEYGLSVDARLYHDQLRDIMFSFPTSNLNLAGDPIGDIGNMFDAQHKGVEVTIERHWGKRNQLTFNYAWQLLKSPFTPLGTGTCYCETMPRNMISALYSTTGDNGLAFSLGYYQQDAVLAIDRPDYDRQQLTRRMDVKLAKKFKLGHAESEGEIAWVVQGLFDGHHIEYADSNVFNRRTYLTATINY
ncbi:MAG: TonB-dependent receptor [Gallionella sp.]